MVFKKNNKHKVLLLMLFIFGVSIAEEIDWYSIDQGGGTSTHSGVLITGVIGQTEVIRMEGGSITISGGYLPMPADLIFENQFN